MSLSKIDGSSGQILGIAAGVSALGALIAYLAASRGGKKD
jgi:hypothetical protein